jgi:Arc/MetJ-type ribon-helix-helix transcriptional regulator
MAQIERVTVSIPSAVVRDIDRRAKNRSGFVAEAIRRELDRRRREDLRISLQNPHHESAAPDDPGLEEWSRSLPVEDTAALVAPGKGRPVRWVPGEGWVEARK